MASTSSLGATSQASNKDAQSFYDSFSTTLRDVRKGIEEATTEVALNSIFEDVAQARTALTDATRLLPSYDRQIHEQHLREVNELLTQKHKKVVPKMKFAFKRKAKTETTSKADSTAEGISDDSSRPPLATEASLTSDYLSIRDKKEQHLTIADLEGKKDKTASDLHILNLTNCVVDLRHLEGRSEFLALQLRRLQNSVILCGRINGSIMIHECTHCVILVECRQFRMHQSSSMAVFISTPSVATIEHCNDIYFAPLANSQGLPSVQDFDHIITNQQSSNWSEMSSERQQQIHEMLRETSPNATVWVDAAGISSN